MPEKTRMNSERKPELLSRREAIKVIAVLVPLAASIVSCARHRYNRPAGELNLGTVRELLYSQVHLRSQAVLVLRDTDGWSALSTRCSYEGCDLTFQEPVLLCPCCHTRFNLDGTPQPGWPATRPLPWIEVYYREGRLYADPGKVKPASYRFTTPEIEEAVRKLKERVKEEGLIDEVKVPGVLKGEGDREYGQMFIEDDPNAIEELKMIK